MSWRETNTGDSYQTAQETDEEKKKSLEKMVATELLNCSILFLISQTSYRTYKIISSYELARPVMGTIFVVLIVL